MFRRILVAVDFSPYSDAAFATAVEIARLTNSILDVLHVFHRPQVIPPELTVTAGSGDETLTTLVRERVQEQLDTLLETASLPHGQALLEDGKPAERIVERAQSSDCDLVVIGSHGHTGLKELVLGGIATKVVRECPKSVLVVRKPYDA
jgi:nucleotide-binding universal stress UspA family protein